MYLFVTAGKENNWKDSNPTGGSVVATFCLRHFTDVANERTKPDQVYQEINRTNLTQSLAVCARDRSHRTNPNQTADLWYRSATQRRDREDDLEQIWKGKRKDMGGFEDRIGWDLGEGGVRVLTISREENPDEAADEGGLGGVAGGEVLARRRGRWSGGDGVRSRDLAMIESAGDGERTCWEWQSS